LSGNHARPSRVLGDAWRDGIDGGARYSRSPVSGAGVSGAGVSGALVSGAPVSGAPVSASPVSGPRPASRQLLRLRLRDLCQNPVNRFRARWPPARRRAPPLQLCNTRSVHWGRRAFGPNFVWRLAALSGYVRYQCLGRCAGSCGGSLLAGHVFACENSRVGRRG
jgi:hypothetical protein